MEPTRVEEITEPPKKARQNLGQRGRSQKAMLGVAMLITENDLKKIGGL